MCVCERERERERVCERENNDVEVEVVRLIFFSSFPFFFFVPLFFFFHTIQKNEEFKKALSAILISCRSLCVL